VPWGADRPAATLAWILALTWTHARSMSCDQKPARLGCVESVTIAALKISCLRLFMTWSIGQMMSTCARQLRHVTTSAIVVYFCASIRVRQPRPNIGDWECIIPDIRIDSSN